MQRFGLVLGAVLYLAMGVANAACIRNANDANYYGPLVTTSSEYKLPAAIDGNVLSGVATEAWGRIYRPNCLDTNYPRPLLVFLHGNHSTCGSGNPAINETGCQYTFGNACPAGSSVILNHLGYDYLADRLASYGFMVVSINANRGITCGNPVTGDSGLNLARGRLVLKTLSLLSDWNKNARTTPGSLGFDLYHQIDFSNVGYFGHSRGGEGVRAAYNLYKDAGSPWPSKIPTLNVRGIFEVGPTDGQTARVLNAVGTAWNVLLPMCDGDVSTLTGMKPYDRMLYATGEVPAEPKSMYAVWGANHNFYNSYWQKSDSSGCFGNGNNPLWNGDGGSDNERWTAIRSVVPFFRAHVGTNNNPSLASIFDPLNAAQLTFPRIDRTFINSPRDVNNSDVYTRRLENFQGVQNIGSLGIPHSYSNLTVKTHKTVGEHDSSLKAIEVAWPSAGDQTFFQDNWSVPSSGYDIRGYQTLDFRMSRALNNALNTANITTFGVSLVWPDGCVGTPEPVGNYANYLVGPVGAVGKPHSTLHSVRIPLGRLFKSNCSRRDPLRNAFIMGVRFTFNSTATGDIFLSDIGLSKYPNYYGDVYSRTRVAMMPWSADIYDSRFDGMLAPTESESITGLRTAEHPPAEVYNASITRKAGLTNGQVEIEVVGSEMFPARGALTVLSLDGVAVADGMVPASGPHAGDQRYLIFRVNPENLKAMGENFKAVVGHKEDPTGATWELGTLSRAVFQAR